MRNSGEGKKRVGKRENAESAKRAGGWIDAAEYPGADRWRANGGAADTERTDNGWDDLYAAPADSNRAVFSATDQP